MQPLAKIISRKNQFLLTSIHEYFSNISSRGSKTKVQKVGAKRSRERGQRVGNFAVWMPTRTVMQQDNRSSRHDGVAKSGQRGEREPVGWPFIDYRFGHGDEQKPLAVQWPKLCPLKRLFRPWKTRARDNVATNHRIQFRGPTANGQLKFFHRGGGNLANFVPKVSSPFQKFHPQTRVFILRADLFQKIAKNLRIYRRFLEILHRSIDIFQIHPLKSPKFPSRSEK